jgi:hypothetical protein
VLSLPLCPLSSCNSLTILAFLSSESTTNRLGIFLLAVRNSCLSLTIYLRAFFLNNRNSSLLVPSGLLSIVKYSAILCKSYEYPSSRTLTSLSSLGSFLDRTGAIDKTPSSASIKSSMSSSKLSSFDLSKRSPEVSELSVTAELLVCSVERGAYLKERGRGFNRRDHDSIS